MTISARPNDPTDPQTSKWQSLINEFMGEDGGTNLHWVYRNGVLLTEPHSPCPLFTYQLPDGNWFVCDSGSPYPNTEPTIQKAAEEIEALLNSGYF